MWNSIKHNLLDLVMLVLAFFSPVETAVLAVIVLCFFDTITGIIAAYKRGEKITSNKGFRTIIKIVVYSILILCSHLIEKTLLDYIPLVKIATSAVALIELKSLYENASSILGLDLWKFVKQMMDKKNIDVPEIQENK